MNLRYDSVGSTFSFNLPFDPENKEQAEYIRPLEYQDCTVEHAGQLLITGTVLASTYKSGAVQELVQLAGYSKPGILEDCEIPTKLYPLQTDGLSLKEIIERITKPFGLKLIVDEIAASDAGLSVKQKAEKKISRSSAKESKNIKTYFTELAKQRHIILTHNNKGELVLTEAKTDKEPLFHVQEKGTPATKINLSISGQALHSHITVIKQADIDGGSSSEYTIENPYCKKYRSKVVVMNSGDDITIQEYAINVLAAELKEAIKLVIETDRWKIRDEVITPNNMVSIYSPKNYIYEKTKFFIEEVNFSGNEKETTATLTCVLPEVYNGKIPAKNIFIDPSEKLPRTLKNYRYD